MNDASLAVIDHAEMQLVWKRRSIPELKQRPGERDCEDVCLAETGWLASAGIGFSDHHFKRFPHRRGLNAVRHRVPHLTHCPKAKGSGSSPLPPPKITSSLFPCRT